MKPVNYLWLFLIILCTSCYKDVSLPLTAEITSTTLPDSAQPGVKTNFVIYFQKPESCANVIDPVMTQTGDTIEYRILLQNPDPPCGNNLSKDSIVETFQKDDPGMLYFRFFTDETIYMKDSVIIRFHEDLAITSN
ncbi:hypothetical protein RCC89_00495 [Cytophagaceae bacterium ABcell3]|nr:hypothetical protein RCC89_00495 [Cytophagaceae bacterium ABcell3]